MSKRGKIILTFVVVIMVLLLIICSIPGIVACSLYHKIISKPQALEILSVEPQNIKLPEPNLDCNFSLGFAEMSLCPNSINTISYRPQIGVICRTDSNCLTYSFLPPDNPAEVTYEVLVKAANVMPLKYSEIFFSKPYSIYYRIMTAYIFKVSQSFNQKGIGLFETKNIKGLIHFGSQKNPYNIMADVFSKDGNISQLISVCSGSPEKSKEAMFSLLSSYRLTISQANDSNYLDELVMSQLSGNSKFEIDDANK